MGIPLDSARSKLGRADQHLEGTRLALPAILGPDSYAIEVQLDPDPANPGGVVILARGDISEAATFLGLCVGDVVHNLRGALDHIVWALSIGHSGPPPADLKGWRQVEFPIFCSASAYDGTPSSNGASGPKKLRWVNQGLHATFRELQPFHAGKEAATHPLWLLQELANLDKHRSIPIVAMLIKPAFSAHPAIPGLPPLPEDGTAARLGDI